MSGVSVRAQDFGWHYPNRPQPACQGLSFEIPAGQKVLLLGPSGAGKSTLLLALAGLLEDEGQQTGSLYLDGRPLGGQAGADQQLAGLGPGRPVGLLQQDPESSLVLERIGDDTAFGPENLGLEPEEIWARVDQALEAVGLGHLDQRQSSSQLSGGQKQRLGLAGILAMRPGLILLDEPTANLDEAGVEEVRRAILEVADQQGATLLMIEHRVEAWLDQVDRVLVIDAPERGPGTLCHDGPPAQVLEEAREELIQAGIWVPGYRPALEPRAGKGAQAQLNPSGQPAASAQLSVSAHPAASAQPGSLAGRQTAPLLEAQDLGLSRSVLSARTRRQALAAQQAQDPSYRLQLPLLAEGINLTLEAGEHLAITGPNGSGKSSLGLVLAGLLPPAAGLLTAGPQLRSPHRGPMPGSSQTQQQAQLRPGPLSWLGRRKPQDLGPAPISWPAAELAARIGLVFQNPEQQFLTGSVREELEFGLRNLARSRRQPLDPQALGQASDLLLERSGLAHLAQANPFTLSGGEKRRLSVASALASEPDLLILDEPTFGQDTKTWAQLLNLLSQLLEEGKTIISITHDQAYLQALGGRVYQMQAEGGRR